MANVYEMVSEFKRKYPKTVAFRLKKHAEVIDMHLNPNEKILYAFPGQNNSSSLFIMNSCVVALTNKRIIIGVKRVLWGYFFTAITPDMYNDLEVNRSLVWSSIEIDTLKENFYISNLDPQGAIEAETRITEFMMKEKRKYEK